MSNNHNIRNSIFNSYSPETQKKFAARKPELYDDSRVFDLLLAMNLAEQGKTTSTGSPVTVQNQGELTYLNGVKMETDPYTGRPIFKEV